MDHAQHGKSAQYEKNSLSLMGAVAMGTGVMIGAGIFALTGQVAELAREWFPLAFLAAAVISGFSAYSYIKMSNDFPSAGGIAMFLKKAYGKGTITGACALLMYFSMVINESLVARTFGTYTLQLFDVGQGSLACSSIRGWTLTVCIFSEYTGNKFIQTFSFLMAFIKIVGLALRTGGLWVSGLNFESISLAT